MPADVAVHALPNNTAPLTTDELYLVGNAAISPTDQKVQLQNVGKGIPIDLLAAPTGTTTRRVTNAQDGLVPTAPGDNGQVLLGTALWGAPPNPRNQLMNGGFWFAQRQTPGTLTTIAQDKYGFDRWRMSRENADIQTQRNDATSTVGLASLYYGSFRKITNTGKFMAYQILEGGNSMPLRGKKITFQCMMHSSANKTIRMGVIELQAAGTIDTIPATFISAWGANTVDPTLGANLAYVAGVASKSVLVAGWNQFSITVTLPTTSKNFIFAIWSDSQFAAADQLDVAEVMVTVCSVPVGWAFVEMQQELARCQRYYEKSFNTDIAPADNQGTTSEIDSPCSSGGLVDVYSQFIAYKQTKRITPTLVYYNPAQVNAGTWQVWSSGGAGIGATPTISANTQQGFSVKFLAAVYTLTRGAWTAECEL
jgi:hypothetical protein